MSEWIEHVERWRGCQRCPLGQQRDRICLARGTVPCDVVFVGEAPGASEDAHGLPFYGPAGHILDQIIDRAVPRGVTYALTNLVACYPRWAKMEGVNEPEPSEIEACRPRLGEFIALASPKLLVMVGSLADKYTPSAIPNATLYAGGAVDGHASLRRWTSIIHPAATMGNRMPAVQKQSAIQHAVVVLRNAVESIMGVW